MDGSVTGGDKPEAGGNREIIKQERTRNGGAGGATQRGLEGRADSGRGSTRTRAPRAQSPGLAPVLSPSSWVCPSAAWASPALYHQPTTLPLPQNTESSRNRRSEKRLVRKVPCVSYSPGTGHVQARTVRQYLEQQKVRPWESQSRAHSPPPSESD